MIETYPAWHSHKARIHTPSDAMLPCSAVGLLAIDHDDLDTSISRNIDIDFLNAVRGDVVKCNKCTVQ